MLRKYVVLSLMIILLFLLFCTKNKNPMKPAEPDPHRFIRGKVTLENQTNHAHCPVVLDSLIIGAHTDSSGYYEIYLEDSLAYVTGNFSLYFYLYDYELDSLDVLLQDGKVVWAAADVDENGLMKPVLLKQLLSIRMTSDKTHYKVGDNAHFTIQLTNTSEKDFYKTPNDWQAFYDISKNSTEWYPPQDIFHSYYKIESGVTYFGEMNFQVRKEGKGYFLYFIPIYYSPLCYKYIPDATAIFLLKIEIKYPTLVNSGGPFFVFVDDPKNLNYPLIEIIK